jgi:VCBS repeat protein
MPNTDPADAPGMTYAMRRLALALAALSFAPAARATIGTPLFEWSRCPAGYCDTGWYASPAVIDVDRDRHVDVLGGGYRLMAVDGATGALEWTYPPSGSPGRMWPDVAVADLDGDGQREIVVVQSDALSVLTSGGALRSGWPQSPFGTDEMRTLAVADLDGDGTKEILTARASGGSYDTWTVLEPNGTVRPGWPRLDPIEPLTAWGAYNQNLAVGDLLGDGALEVFGSSDTHYLDAFDAAGNQLPADAVYGAGKKWYDVGVHYSLEVDLRTYANCDAGVPPLEPRPNFADAAPAIGDLDGDGANEMVIVGSFYDCRTPNYDQLFQVPMIFRADRTRWSNGTFDWTTPPAWDATFAPLSTDYNVIESAEANPVLADLDGDGVKEILYASYDGRVHAFWLDRTEHGAWPFDVNLGSTAIRFASEPVVVDLDGDGKSEVIFTTWTEKGSNQRGDLFIVGWNGAEISHVQLPTSAEDWDGALAAPTVAQLDGDPNLEVVVNTAHTGLVAYEIPGATGGAMRWPTGRGNVARTAPEPDAWLGGALASLMGFVRLRLTARSGAGRRSRA